MLKKGTGMKPNVILHSIPGSGSFRAPPGLVTFHVLKSPNVTF